jgi:RNA polymerase-binding transcription factor DksA
MLLLHCNECDEPITPQARAELGYTTCLSCGDKQARATVRTVAPMHKSNYMLFTDPADLKGINNKGGFHRE